MNWFWLFLSYNNNSFVFPQLVLMVTNTHVALDIGNHTKVSTKEKNLKVIALLLASYFGTPLLDR